MSKITRYEEPSRITRFRPSGVKPEPIHSGWTNFVSQRSVRAIAIASNSRCLWLATWGGVIAWKWKDDTSYQRYSSEHGLVGNEAACLCLDENEHPWVGHREGGLSYFNGQSWQVYPHLQKRAIRALAGSDTCQGIWAAVDEAGHETLYYISKFNEPPISVVNMLDDSKVDISTLLVNQKQLLTALS